jgi:hypothetical protein
MPFDIINEFLSIDSLAEDYGEYYMDDYEDLMYSPCTIYTLSKLGIEYTNNTILGENQR